MSENYIYHLSSIRSNKQNNQSDNNFEYAGGYFNLSNKGILYFAKDKDGNSLPARWVCSRLKVVAKTRDAKSGEWGRLLEWSDDDGVSHQWAMPMALLQTDTSDLRRELASLGLAI